MKATLENRPTNHRPTREEYVAPDVNIFETQDAYVLEAERPGVNKAGLEITLEGNELTLVGHRGTDPVNGEPILRERPLADYRRVFELDPTIDTTKVSAK